VKFAHIPWGKRFALTASLLSTASLGGCANSTVRSSMMLALDEMTTGSKASNYLPVGDLPLSHQVLMTAGEQVKAKKDLIAARDEAAVKAAQQQHEKDAWLRSGAQAR
jgi:hypothetical protein